MVLLAAACTATIPQGADVADPAAVVAAGAGRVAAPTPAPPTATPPPTPTASPTPAPTPTPTPDPRGFVLERRLLGTAPPAQIAQTNARLYPPGTALPPRYPVDQYLVRFLSTDERGAPLEILAQLFVPRPAAAASLPVYVFGAGTTGLGDQCAPSREQPTVRNWGDYPAHMLSYATQGYIAILPDYEGFNDDGRLHHYFVAELEARVLLDAARAAYRFFDGQDLLATPAAAVFLAGYSQGGHAAFAARDRAPRYAPELPLRGAIGYGATTDIAALLKENSDLAPYLLYAYADYYGAERVDPGRLLLGRWLPTLAADVTTKCIDAVPRYYGRDPRQVYHPAFLPALYDDRLGEAFPALKEVFDQNSSGLVPSSVPALLLQGTGDPIVTPRTQEAFVRKLCAAGGRVTYLTYRNVHHYQTRQVSYQDTLRWMQSILDGQTPSSVCAGA